MFKLKLTLTLLLSIACLLANADSKTPGKVIAGYVEKVVIENQDFNTKAKLDTGAKTSSIYASNIERYRKNGQRWVRFTLMIEDSKNNLKKTVLEKQRSRKVKIKDNDGEHEVRPVVELDICFNGRHYTTEFTLADRQQYIYTVLLGREFLEGVAIVDPEEAFLTLGACE